MQRSSPMRTDLIRKTEVFIKNVPFNKPVTVARVLQGLKTRKLCYRKDDRAMPPCDLYMDALKFSGLPDYAHRYYSKHFSRAFVPIEAMNVRTKFEVRSFTRS